MKRLKNKSGVPLQHSTFSRRNGYSRLRQQESRRRESLWWIPEQVCIWSATDLKSAELETMKTSRSPTTVANGEVQTREEASVYVKEFDVFVKVMLREETPAVLSLEKLCDEHGYTFHCKSGQNPHLIKNGKRIDCNFSNCVPFVVPGLSASSSATPTPASSSSSSQDSVFDVNRHTGNPVPERSGSTSKEPRRNPLHKPTETENNIKNEVREEVENDLLHDLPDWLKEFRENLVDERNPSEPRGNPELGHRDTSSSSHELSMESRAKVEPGSGKHLKTKITRASCRRRTAEVKKVNLVTITDT